MRGCWWLCKQWLSKSVNHSGLGWPLSETGGGLLEFRGGMQNGSNLTSHTPSQFYQHLCWSAATAGCINHLSCPLQCIRRMRKGNQWCKNSGFRLILLSLSMLVGDYMELWRRVFCCSRGMSSLIMPLIPRFAVKVMCAVDADLKWKMYPQYRRS